MLTSGTGDAGLAGELALGISVLSLIVSACALRYTKVQADASKGMLDVEQGRDAEARASRRVSSSANVDVQQIPAAAPGIATIRVSNMGPGHAKAMRVDLERVRDGKQFSPVAREKLAKIAAIEAGDSCDVSFPMAPDGSRSFTLLVAWTDTKRNVVHTQIDIG